MTHDTLHHLPTHDDVLSVEYGDGCYVRRLSDCSWMVFAPGEERLAVEPDSPVAYDLQRSLPLLERGTFV